MERGCIVRYDLYAPAAVRFCRGTDPLHKTFGGHVPPTPPNFSVPPPMMHKYMSTRHSALLTNPYLPCLPWSVAIKLHAATTHRLCIWTCTTLHSTAFHNPPMHTTRKAYSWQMAQDVGMVWKYCGVILSLIYPGHVAWVWGYVIPILFGGVWRFPSLHVLVFIQKKTFFVILHPYNQQLIIAHDYCLHYTCVLVALCSCIGYCHHR